MSSRAADSRIYHATLFVVACLLYTAGRAPFFGQWDSFDYLKQTVTHRLSDLGFGRPVFIGYNIALWEVSRRLFGLAVAQVDAVLMAGVIIAGGLGILAFSGLAGRMLHGRAARMAVLALLLSPMYAVYSGFIMTEVPMLAVLTTAAFVLWTGGERYPTLSCLAGGTLFGLAVGIREQAITLGAGFLWILFVRRSGLAARARAFCLFGAIAAVAIAAPVLALYINNPARFFARTQTWLHSIPMGESHFWGNLQATLLFALAVCPGAWLGLLAAGIRRFRYAPSPRHGTEAETGRKIPHPVWGFVCAVLLPLAALLRDADVQIHPRYAMIILPGTLILCVVLYNRWLPGRKAAVGWVLLQFAVFAVAQIGIMPLRQIQREKREFTRLVMRSVPDSALVIAGGYSPILDYYRGIGEKPAWYVLWSGWGWDRRSAESTIRGSWRQGQPVYWCNGPYGWLYFEDEWLDLYFIFKGCRSEQVAPGIVRMFRR